MNSFKAIMASLGNLLQIGREEKGLDRETLATRAGLDPGRITQIEEGVVDPTQNEFQKIIGALGLPKKVRGEGGRILGMINPRRKKTVKFHWKSSILKQRSRRHGYRNYR